MKRKVKKGLALAWLVCLLLMASVGLAQADGSGPSVVPGFRPSTILENPKEIRTSQENPSSRSAVMHTRNVATGQTQSGGGFWGWLQDHGQGLLYGLAEGMAVAAGVVAVGALLSVGAPVLAVAAGAAVLGAAAYGLFTGAERFNVWECGVYALIGAVSARGGQGLAAATLAGRGLAVARAAVDVVGGGLAGLASYLLYSQHPTWGGAAGAFGVGAATAGLFLGLGYGWGKLKAALGLSGWGAAGNSSAVVADGLAYASERGGGESAGTVVVASNPAALKRATGTTVAEAEALAASRSDALGVYLSDCEVRTRRALVMANIAESRAARQTSNFSEYSRIEADIAEVIRRREEAFQYYMRRVEELDVSTTWNQAVFYSGPGNRARAEEFAILNGRTTLEMTPGGRWLEDQKLFGPNSPISKQQARQVWARLSQRYAQGASGTVVAFVEGASPEGIFSTVEYPALQANPNIVNVLTGGH